MINEQIIQEVTETLKTHIDPQKIILFGSYAYGKPHEDSDLDLFLVKDIDKSEVRQYRLFARKALRKIQEQYKIGLDVFIDSMDRAVERMDNLKDYFYLEIFNKGKVLYEK
jgi:predicted nucleotidyltransferase